MRIALAASVALAAIALTGCGSTQKAAATPSNEMCPIGKEPVSASVSTVRHKGQTVGFCCEGCKDMWETMSVAERDAALDEASRME